jgi:G3E family GTPase
MEKLHSDTNIILIGGFLGSGKTSILIQLARYLVERDKKSEGISVVIIENEIGDVGVDDKLLKSQGFAVKDLFAGCACCSSGGELLYDIDRIKKEIDPKWIIIEATGVAYPRQIKESVEAFFQIPVRILVIADASRWIRLRKAMSGLMEAQTDAADYILLNKVDIVDEETAELVTTDLKSFNPEAPIRRITGIAPIEKGVLQSILQM